MLEIRGQRLEFRDKCIAEVVGVDALDDPKTREEYLFNKQQFILYNYQNKNKKIKFKY